MGDIETLWTLAIEKELEIPAAEFDVRPNADQIRLTC